MSDFERKAHEIITSMFAEARKVGKADNATEAALTERVAMWSDEISVLVATAYDHARAHRNDPPHTLGCDEAHLHGQNGMDCCAESCWCKRATILA